MGFPLQLLMFALRFGTRCDLEDHGWCLFEEERCVFSDVYRLPSDKSSPLEVLLDRNIRSKNTNNGCPLPQPSNETNPKPFVIEIEPCFSNGTATPADLQACPDIPDEYYTKLGKPVLSDTGNINNAAGAIMGIPIEYNVLSIGKNLMLGNIQNTKSKQSQSGVKGTLLSKFKWRTLPLTAEAYAKTMEETASTFVNVSKLYTSQVGLKTNTFWQYHYADNPPTDGSNTKDFHPCIQEIPVGKISPNRPTSLPYWAGEEPNCYTAYWGQEGLWANLGYPTVGKMQTCMIPLGCNTIDEEGDYRYWTNSWPLVSYETELPLFGLDAPIPVITRTLQERIPIPGCQWISQISTKGQPKYLNLYENSNSILDYLRAIELKKGTFIGELLAPSTYLDGPLRDWTVPSDMSFLDMFGASIGIDDIETYIVENSKLTDIFSQAGFVSNLQLFGTNVLKTMSQNTCAGVTQDNKNIKANGAATLYLLAYMLGQVALYDPKAMYLTETSRDIMNKTYGIDVNQTVKYFNPLPYGNEPVNIPPDRSQANQVRIDMNPDFAGVQQIFQTLLQSHGGSQGGGQENNYLMDLGYTFIPESIRNEFGAGATAGPQSFFWSHMKDCLTGPAFSGKWNPMDCVCFPATITPEMCAKNLDPAEPLNVVVGDAEPAQYKEGRIDPPPVSLLPYQELTCPLEVQFADDRTPDMSPKKQRDNVYVASSTLLADIPTAFQSVGRGCYMCFANRYDNLTKTLETPMPWLDHYDPQRCSGKRVIPTVKGTVDDIYNGPGTKEETDAQSLYLPGRDFRYTMDQPLGVYTLYPYFELEPIPYQFAKNVNVDPGDPTCKGKPNCGADSVNFQQWEDNLARQIGYYLNPDWWVTVEVVGIEKAKGSQVLRNFHGRILEEGLVDFEAAEFTYNIPNSGAEQNEFQEQIQWQFWLGKESPFYPNNCVFNTINMDLVKSDTKGKCIDSDGKFEPTDANGDCVELACQSDIPGDTVYNILRGNLTINFNIDIGDTVKGFNEMTGNNDFANPTSDPMNANPYAFLIASTESAGGFILPSQYDGITNPYVEDAIEFVTQLPLVRRKDGVCIDRPGEVAIEMPFAAQCLFGLDTEKTTRTITKSACQPEKVVEWYNRGGMSTETPGTPANVGPAMIDISDWIQDMFLEVHPTGVAKDILDVFDSIEFKLALALLAFEDPALADVNFADIIWCLSPTGPTTPLKIIEYLLLFCQACTPGSDSSEVKNGSPGECFTYEGGAPCLGYVGPPDPGSSDRNSPGWASVQVVEYPVQCMFEQVAKVIRPAMKPISIFKFGNDDASFNKARALNGELELFNMCDLPFLQRMFEMPFKHMPDDFPRKGPLPQQINDESVSGIVLSAFTLLDNVPNVVDEINIMGVTIENALFSRTDPTMFPNGLFVTSTHPLIHTKISRDLGSGQVTERGCNVVLIGIPDITFYNVEFDNSACQEQGLNQLTYETANDFRAMENSPSTMQRAFLELKAWNMAPIHVTNVIGGISPTNLNFTSVKLTASTTFRRMFPGRPLMSIDNDGSAGGAFVNVDRMFLSEINDTHKYRDTRDVNAGNKDPVDLMPLHIIFWHVAGECTLGTFQEELDIVTFSERSAFTLDYTITSTDTTDGPCRGITSPALNDTENSNSFLQYKTKCLSLGCKIQLAGKQDRDWEKQKRATFCRKPTEFPIVNNLVVLDGADFFDM